MPEHLQSGAMLGFQNRKTAIPASNGDPVTFRAGFDTVGAIGQGDDKSRLRALEVEEHEMKDLMIIQAMSEKKVAP